MNSRRPPQRASATPLGPRTPSSIAPPRPTGSGLSSEEFRAVIADAKRRKSLGELLTGVRKQK